VAIVPWLLLVLAGLLEVAWAIGLKYTDGFRRPLPSLLTVLAMIGSFVLLARAVRVLPIGTGYAVWVGIGAIGTALVGAVLFHEPLGGPRIACLGLLIAGIVGLKLLSPH
jgi:quaternary ammonium compound-resistance protein SugE